ncbi:unnamed protein product [Gordionus sp. m RMFG-2023]
MFSILLLLWAISKETSSIFLQRSYDPLTGRCETFEYRSYRCVTLTNLYDSLSECRESCHVYSITREKRRRSFDKYFYSPMTLSCRLFEGYCKGNVNLFTTDSACKKNCGASPKNLAIKYLLKY